MCASSHAFYISFVLTDEARGEAGKERPKVPKVDRLLALLANIFSSFAFTLTLSKLRGPNLLTVAVFSPSSFP